MKELCFHFNSYLYKKNDGMPTLANAFLAQNQQNFEIIAVENMKK